MRDKTRADLLILALLLAACGACSLPALTNGKGIGEAAVAQFHSRYNAGRYHEIYMEADEEFRKSATEEEFITLLEAIKRKLGTVAHAGPAGWNVNVTTAGTLVSLGYNVEFSEGKGTEQFAFRVRGDKAFLYNYNVNSNLLITK